MKFYDSGDWLQVVAAKGIQSNVTAQITWWERNYFGRSTIFRHCFPYCNCSTRKTCSHSSTWMCGLLDYSLHHFHFPTLSDSFLSPLFWQSVIFSPTFCKPISPYSMCFKSQGSSFILPFQAHSCDHPCPHLHLISNCFISPTISISTLGGAVLFLHHWTPLCCEVSSASNRRIIYYSSFVLK